jgi:hypothetical protein
MNIRPFGPTYPAACRQRLAAQSKEVVMRTIVLVAAAIAALPLTLNPAKADGGWCAYDVKGATNCGFHTYAQCQANISGIGGYCSPNPAFAGNSRQRSRY